MGAQNAGMVPEVVVLTPVVVPAVMSRAKMSDAAFASDGTMSVAVDAKTTMFPSLLRQGVVASPVVVMAPVLRKLTRTRPPVVVSYR